VVEVLWRVHFLKIGELEILVNGIFAGVENFGQGPEFDVDWNLYGFDKPIPDVGGKFLV
jgi:hypothetical protein